MTLEIYCPACSYPEDNDYDDAEFVERTVEDNIYMEYYRCNKCDSFFTVVYELVHIETTLEKIENISEDIIRNV